MKRIILSVLTVLSLSSLPAVAEPMTYDSMVALLKTHPSLTALRYEEQALEESAEAELGLPDPMIEMGINNYPIDGGGFTRYAMTNKMLGFTQKIPSWEERKNSRNIIQRSAEKTQIMATLTHQRLEAELITILADLERIMQQRSLLLREKDLLSDEQAYWQGRLESGDNTLDEQARVDADLAQVDARLAMLDAQKAESRANIIALTGLEAMPDALPTLPDHAPVNWPEEALTLLPVALSDFDTAIAQEQVKKAGSAFNPDYQVSVKYSQRDASTMYDDGDWVSAMVGLSVPLWYSDNQAPKLRAARLRMAKAKAGSQDTVRQWHSRLTTLKAKIAENEATTKALKAKKNAIESRVDTLQTSYESDGRLDIMIAAQRSALDIAFQLAGKTAEKHKLIANFNSFFTHEKALEKGINND